MSNSDASLYGRNGQGRKYVNHDERMRFLDCAARLETGRRLFVEVLAWTGGRVSEVLAVTPQSFDLDGGSVVLPTLKRRRSVAREIPLPPELIRALDDFFELQSAQRDGGRASRRLWSFTRVTGWRIVKRVMDQAGILGARAAPRGLRHGFGVGVLQAGVPITLLKRWLGHARLSTTGIYAAVIGPEERGFAARFWKAGGGSRLEMKLAA